MSLGKFLISRTFLKHLAIAVLFVALLLFITIKGLNIYTNHGESYPVPALTGLNIDEAIASAEANKLRVRVIDSVFNTKFEPGAVVDQLPLANSNVKENRVILLTINSMEPEKVKLPKLTDISFRQAKVLIENIGLIIGNIAYLPSEYDDLVLKVEQNENTLFTGQEIVKGTSIDLTIGRSKGNLKTALPNLTGFTIEEALATLTDSRLNEGVKIFDESIVSAEDSIAAKVWKQSPNPKFVKNVELGSSIDIWLTIDEDKLNEAYEN